MKQVIHLNEIDVEIRPFTEEDMEAVAALWHEVFPDAHPWNKPEDDIARKLQVQRELFLVATIDDQLIGTAMAGYDGHRGWIYLLAVNFLYRRKGIGEALMRRVEQDLAVMGCHKLNLQVRANNHEVVAFYKKMDYNVEDRVSMGKLLNSDG